MNLGNYLTALEPSLLQFFLKQCLFIFEREREREREREKAGRARVRGGQRIRSKLCADSKEPNGGLEPMNHDIMT